MLSKQVYVQIMVNEMDLATLWRWKKAISKRIKQLQTQTNKGAYIK